MLSVLESRKGLDEEASMHSVSSVGDKVLRVDFQLGRCVLSCRGQVAKVRKVGEQRRGVLMRNLGCVPPNGLEARK